MIQFVTGTDTGVGKTTAAAALAQRYRKEGKQVRYFKPVQTGLGPGEPGDADFVAAVAGIEVEEGQRFQAPLAPAVAAAQASQRGEYGQLLETASRLAQDTDVLQVEGAGGLLVPLTPEQTVADLARDLRSMLVVATRPGLGSLNHTALTLEAARSRQLQIQGLVICGWPRDPGVLYRTNLELRGDMAPLLGLVGVCDGLDTAVPRSWELPFLGVAQARD